MYRLLKTKISSRTQRINQTGFFRFKMFNITRLEVKQIIITSEFSVKMTLEKSNSLKMASHQEKKKRKIMTSRVLLRAQLNLIISTNKVKNYLTRQTFSFRSLLDANQSIKDRHCQFCLVEKSEFIRRSNISGIILMELSLSFIIDEFVANVVA